MDKRKTVITDRQEKQIVDLYSNDKCTVKKVSQLTGFKRFTVQNVLKRANIVCRENKKYAYNDTIFECIDTEHKAYWLGFVYADGDIVARKGQPPAYVRLGLGIKDVEHLQRFSHFMSDDSLRVETREETNEAKSTTKRVTICSRKIAADLVALGCFPRKSLTIEFPTLKQVPEQLMRHFIRGFFDGNGSMYTVHNKGRSPSLEMSFNSTQKFLDALVLFLHTRIPDVTNKGVKREGMKNNFRLRKNAKQARAICRWMYTDSTICLDRKYQRYLQYQDKPS